MLLAGQQKVYPFVSLFLIFLSNGKPNKIINVLTYIASRTCKPGILQKRPHIGVHECNLHLEEQGSQLIWGVGRPYHL